MRSSEDSNSPSASILLPPRHSNVKRKSNVFRLLARREISPQTKDSSRNLWREDSKSNINSPLLRGEAARDVKRSLISWVEAESLRNFTAKYCPLLPPPRSTIAAAFSPDGKTLASTHGDHTVKIIDCQTGKCLKVLSGHRRTPWVVRFHPLCPDILASGSLDHEVRIWNAKTAECIVSRDFYRPIASIAFDAQGGFLAVASGHKLYIWHYSERREIVSVTPSIILKTRRSLRAVHFHPHAAPFLLTAEVNELDSSDSKVTLATCQNYLRYPPPTVYLADAHPDNQSRQVSELPLMTLPFLLWPSIGRGDGRIPSQETDGDVRSTSTTQRAESSGSVRLLTYSTPSGQYELLLSPIEPGVSPVPQEPEANALIVEMESDVTNPTVDAMDVQPQRVIPFVDTTSWEVPFLQGWFIGQSQAGQQTMHPFNVVAAENISSSSRMENHGSTAPSMLASSSAQSRVNVRSGSHHHYSHPYMSSAGSGGSNLTHDESESQHFVERIQSEIATSLAAAAAAELPCTVKLRIWPHNLKKPCRVLDAERCRLIIPHAVLCSEMGAHFSPCGRFLAACVACVLPNVEADAGFPGQQVHPDVIGVSTSPTRHPISAQEVVYELRIYSLEEATFGMVLASRAIRAAHCLTSIQFSPTSEHLLLAYGRRHSSLLKSVVIDGETTVPVYTILEVYRVSDMELVRVLPSAEDEVNVACFHPAVGGGLVYGTKEGKLRIFQYNVSNGLNYSGTCSSEEDMIEGLIAEH